MSELFDLVVASGVRDAWGSGENCAWLRPSQVTMTPPDAIFLREGVTLKLLSLLDSTSASTCPVLGVACFCCSVGIIHLTSFVVELYAGGLGLGESFVGLWTLPATTTLFGAVILLGGVVLKPPLWILEFCLFACSSFGWRCGRGWSEGGIVSVQQKTRQYSFDWITTFSCLCSLSFVVFCCLCSGLVKLASPARECKLCKL